MHNKSKKRDAKNSIEFFRDYEEKSVNKILL